MRKPALGAAAAATALLFMSIATPAQAITNGGLDGDGHPAVGLMVAFVEVGEDANGDPEYAPAWR